MNTTLKVTIIFWVVFPHLVNSQFKEVAQDVGIDHYHKNNELLGGGASFFDYDNDGFIDIYLTGGLPGDRLYKNLGNKTFSDVSEMAGLRDITIVSSSGVITGDINNDGCDDVFVSTFDRYPNQLLLNNCDGTFTEISHDAGIIEIGSSTGATFIDINEDGFLDIYVINYVETPKFIRDDEGEVIGFDHDCYPNFLYINDGNLHFTEMASDFGVDNIGCGLAVAATDINQDGHTDLYLANDFGEWVLPNEAYLNLTPGTILKPRGLEYNLDAAMYGMGLAIGDIDENFLLDYYVTNIGDNHFLSQETKFSFVEKASDYGIANGFADSMQVTSWGTFFIDFDNDADLDLFVANGSVSSLDFLNTIEQDPDKLYMNNGDGSFTSLASFDSISSSQINRGAVYADYDNDGDLDIFSVSTYKSSINDPRSSFYENISEGGNWISLRLIGTTINKSAFGASITLYANTKTLMRELYGGGSHASQSSKELHFGLGALSMVDSLAVHWGNGSVSEIFYDLPINQKVRISQGERTFEIIGCMDSENTYYNPLATLSEGCFDMKLWGCTDVGANNFNPFAIIDDGSCDYSILQVTNSENQITAFPNPFNDHFILKSNLCEDMQIWLTDLNGRRVRTQNIVYNKTQKIETSDLSNGLYVLKVVDLNGESIFSKKLIKSLAH